MFRKLKRRINKLTGAEKQASALNLYIRGFPAKQTSFDLFADEWSSKVPGFETGPAETFSDDRVPWFSSKIGGFVGKRVLELGPLEGAQTFLVAQEGAKEIIAVESNSRAFLRCLVVQNALHFNAEFRLGDFVEYLAKEDQRFDFILACGVLYHMTDPLRLLELLTKRTDQFGMWTQYYEKEVAQNQSGLRRRLSTRPRIVEFRGRKIETHEQVYQSTDLLARRFCGGMEHKSAWMTKESLLAAIDALGFDVEIAYDQVSAHGPHILLLATKRP